MIGKLLGNYRVVEELGEGGMGVVYVGEHERLGNRVAIKVIHPELSRNEEITQRFFAEALAATRIKHSGICQIFDYGEDPDTGSVFFAMELLDGENLADNMARNGPLPTQTIVYWGRQVADTLRAAHGEHIIHRDLKPDNIFLVTDRMLPSGARVKVLDFGIAKLAHEHLKVSYATRTGAMMGTPYYMSPEQARGRGELDHRSDVYSLGCVLYEMACGQVPFPGEGLGEILGAHQFLPAPPVKTIYQTVSPELDQLIMWMLAKDKEERPDSMTAVIEQLDRVGATVAQSHGHVFVPSTVQPWEGHTADSTKPVPIHTPTPIDYASERTPAPHPAHSPQTAHFGTPTPTNEIVGPPPHHQTPAPVTRQTPTPVHNANTPPPVRHQTPAPYQQTPAPPRQIATTQPAGSTPAGQQLPGHGPAPWTQHPSHATHATPPPGQQYPAPAGTQPPGQPYGQPQVPAPGPEPKITTLSSGAGEVHDDWEPGGGKKWGLIVGGLVVAAAAGAGVFFLTKGDDSKSAKEVPEEPDKPPVLEPPRVESDEQWARIDPPTDGTLVRLGVPDDASDKEVGFRVERGIAAPAPPYLLQKREVTWGDLDPWLQSHTNESVTRPSWVPKQPADRANLPATGVSWITARAYCTSIGADLPTEEQWEFAARGPSLRKYSWGDGAIDLERTNAYGGKRARVVPVGTSPQDVTPNGIYDLMGNAVEWTQDLWREERHDVDESWVTAGGMGFRAVRGLPLAAKKPKRLPVYGAAYRDPLCAKGPCLEDAAPITAYVGFRCAKRLAR